MKKPWKLDPEDVMGEIKLETKSRQRDIDVLIAVAKVASTNFDKETSLEPETVAVKGQDHYLKAASMKFDKERSLEPVTAVKDHGRDDLPSQGQEQQPGKALTFMGRIMASSRIERMIKDEQIYHIKNTEKRVIVRYNPMRRLKAQGIARKLKSILIKKVRGLCGVIFFWTTAAISPFADWCSLKVVYWSYIGYSRLSGLTICWFTFMRHIWYSQ